MCYSAQIEAAYQKLVRMTGATVSLQEFAALYAHDPGKKRPKTPKAMDDAFRDGTSPAERAVWPRSSCGTGPRLLLGKRTVPSRQ